MLSWRRPENTQQIIKNWATCSLFKHRIVFSNLHPPPELPACVQGIHATTDLGLYTRFHAGILTRCDAVFMQDDDLMIPHNTIAQLYGAWQVEPDRIHGLFGRVPKQDGSYAADHKPNMGTDCDIVLTRCLVVSNELLCRFMFDVRQFLNMQSEVYGNAEDIILSHVAKRYSGKPNRVWQLPCRELPQGSVALHLQDNSAHLKHRTRVMHACQKWLASKRIDI